MRNATPRRFGIGRLIKTLGSIALQSFTPPAKLVDSGDLVLRVRQCITRLQGYLIALGDILNEQDLAAPREQLLHV
jgi:hypothetical protein